MRTPRQLAASRRNGAKSEGPKTPEGKARSARNALAHGLNSSVVLLDNEDPDALAHLEAIYKDHWNPATPAEADLVADIVNARWRLHRLLSVESASLDLEMTRRRSEVDAEFTTIDPAGRTALAFHSLADHGCGLAMLSRHEGRLLRVIARATSELRLLQSARTKTK